MRRTLGPGILILLSTCITTMAEAANPYGSLSLIGTVRNLAARYGEPVMIVRHAHSSTYVFKTTSEKYNRTIGSPQIGVSSSGGRPVIVEAREYTNQTAVLTCTYTFEITHRGKIIRSQQEGNGC